MKVTSLRADFVEYMPAKGEPGVIYISQRFRTAMHLCCCGCGMEVVTPLNPAKWTMTQHGDRVSLRPSIGNWSFPCRSHYWIERGNVRWAGPMTAKRIRDVRRLDEAAARREFEVQQPAQPASIRGNQGWIAVVKNWLRSLRG